MTHFRCILAVLTFIASLVAGLALMTTPSAARGCSVAWVSVSCEYPEYPDYPEYPEWW